MTISNAWLKRDATLLIVALLLTSLYASVARAAPTNLLLITVDNLGYGDLPCFNSDSAIRAPRLTQLAREGARLTSFYTASPTCTVSRASLLTGRVPQRHGLQHQLMGVAGNYSVGLNQSEVLLSQVLQTAPGDYATGCFGKWNIGFAPGSRPTERGFDEFVGHASGNLDYYHHHYRDKLDLHHGVQPLQRKGEYATDIFADAAAEFIARHSAAQRPWFCYLPFNAPHFPVAANKRPGQPNQWQAPDWAFAEYGWSPAEADPARRYGAVVMALDRAIGRVLDQVAADGSAEDTFVFFMSDNGAFRLGREGLDVGSNHPLRAGGVTCFEGGLRVAALARWPGRIPPGSVVDSPCWSPDLFVTLAAIAGAQLPAGVALDGKDISGLLCDQSPSPHEQFCFEYESHAALRHGNWKIVRESPHEPWQLYDLALDVAEEHDVAASHADMVSDLARRFNRWQQETQ